MIIELQVMRTCTMYDDENVHRAVAGFQWIQSNSRKDGFFFPVRKKGQGGRRRYEKEADGRNGFSAPNHGSLMPD